MAKRKDMAKGLAIVTGVVLATGFVLYQSDRLPLATCETVIVICFPVFTLSLFLWWMAREHGEDIPFIGY